MNPDKIYIVIGSFSSWDSKYTRVFRAFYSKEDAEKYVVKADRVLGAMSKHIEEAFNRTNPDFDEDLSGDELSKAMDDYEETDEYNKALAIWGAHQNLEEFNRCSIEELKIS
jgi:hypothetical protein